MVSMKHEGLLALFRNRPTLAAELLQEALGVELPPWSEARVESAEFTQVVPTEYRADLVILLLDGKPILAIVVEVQLSAAARQSLEELMKSGKYEYQTEFVRKLRAQGLEQGRQEGLEQGREQGREEGRLVGERMALFKVLNARGVQLDDGARQRILECTEQAQLERWIDKAVTASSVHELFEPIAS